MGNYPDSIFCLPTFLEQNHKIYVANNDSIKIWEEKAASGSLSHKEAIKVYQFFVSNNYLDQLKTIECKFSNQDSFYFNFILFNACKKRTNEIKSIHAKVNQCFLIFSEEDKNLLILIKEWMETRNIKPFIHLNHEELFKVFSICNRHGFEELKRRLNLNLFKSLNLIDYLSIVFNSRDEDCIDFALTHLNKLLPLISFEKNNGNLKIFLKSGNHQIDESLHKDILKTLSQIILQNNYLILLELHEILRIDFHLILTFFKNIGKNINQLIIKVDAFNKSNVGLLNVLILLMPKITHLHLISDSGVVDAYMIKQLIIAMPSTIEYFGIKFLNNLHENYLTGFFQNFGINLKHFYYESEGKFTDYSLLTIAKYCLNLEIIYLDLMNKNSDVTEECFFQFFSTCKRLKTIRIYNSIHSPPCNFDGYDLGIINRLQEGFLERQIIVNYHPIFD